MEHILLKVNVSDITYMSELIPTPIAYSAFAILQLVRGLIRADNLRCTSCLPAGRRAAVSYALIKDV